MEVAKTRTSGKTCQHKPQTSKHTLHNQEQLNEVLREAKANYRDGSKSAKGAGAAWIHLRRHEIIEQKLIKAALLNLLV